MMVSSEKERLPEGVTSGTIETPSGAIRWAHVSGTADDLPLADLVVPWRDGIANLDRIFQIRENRKVLIKQIDIVGNIRQFRIQGPEFEQLPELFRDGPLRPRPARVGVVDADPWIGFVAPGALEYHDHL